MSEQSTKQDIKKLAIVIDEKFVDFEAIIDAKINKAVDDLSDVMQNMMQQISAEFVKVNNRIDELHESIDRLTNTLDGFAKRIEDAEVENAARDAQFKKLLMWARKVSEKTGIPLENL